MRAGEGRYVWRDTDGGLRMATHWNDLPEEMDFLVTFAPEPPPPPHSQADHETMDEFPARLRDALARCRR